MSCSLWRCHLSSCFVLNVSSCPQFCFCCLCLPCSSLMRCTCLLIVRVHWVARSSCPSCQCIQKSFNLIPSLAAWFCLLPWLWPCLVSLCPLSRLWQIYSLYGICMETLLKEKKIHIATYKSLSRLDLKWQNGSEAVKMESNWYGKPQ